MYHVDKYKGIYELPPEWKPAQDVIDDDEQFDQWYDAFQRQLARRGKQGAQRGGGWRDAGEVAFR